MAKAMETGTRWKHMVNDARRLCRHWRCSMDLTVYDAATVPIKNEHDDGRPILLGSINDDMPGLWSVLGSKIDNIYDLLELVE